ncbi:hypothetical protein H8356DRAFT_1280045 [Neocallimastix lanati (nom. inval.)]|nr:hypothetical protein H8356DRAFT_1280045 [Neocallimastix sp. JGI-2020a]
MLMDYKYIEYVGKVLSKGKAEKSIKYFSNEHTNFDFYYTFSSKDRHRKLTKMKRHVLIDIRIYYSLFFQLLRVKGIKRMKSKVSQEIISIINGMIDSYLTPDSLHCDRYSYDDRNTKFYIYLCMARMFLDFNSTVQTLSKRSYYDKLSHIQRVQIPINTESENLELRLSYEYGYFCPFETPEFKDIGRVKYFGLSVLIVPAFTMDLSYLSSVLYDSPHYNDFKESKHE